MGTKAIDRFNDGAHTIAWFENVEIIVSREAPTHEVMQHIVSELENLSKASGQRTGALLIVSSDCSPPSDEARKYIRQGLAGSSMVAAAQVVEGTGFRGAAMRAVLSLLQLAARPSYPMGVFSSIEEGATWLAGEVRKRAGTAPEATALAHAARTIRETLNERATLQVAAR